jgi:hypothetical protein
MKTFDEEDIFYYHSGDDIRRSHSEKLDVYNTEIKSQILFNNIQLNFFMGKTQFS